MIVPLGEPEFQRSTEAKIDGSTSDCVAYVAILKGGEKGEAQVFCDRLFKAFGHVEYKEAGATLEERIKKASGKTISFADLIWKPRLLHEMKKGGEKLHLHYQQAFDYWLNAVWSRARQHRGLRSLQAHAQRPAQALARRSRLHDARFKMLGSSEMMTLRLRTRMARTGELVSLGHDGE